MERAVEQFKSELRSDMLYRCEYSIRRSDKEIQKLNAKLREFQIKLGRAEKNGMEQHQFILKQRIVTTQNTLDLYQQHALQKSDDQFQLKSWMEECGEEIRPRRLILSKADFFTGYLVNNGHDITFEIEELRWKGVNISAGPVSYNYRVKEIKFHFGTNNSYGSEHSINGKIFPAEIHILAYNSDLYEDIREAENSPRGVLIIALFAQIADVTHGEFQILVKAMSNTKYKGDKSRIKEFYLSRLLPPTDYFITYDGSLTSPGCFETVTWVIFNKPIYISKRQIKEMRKLNQASRNNPQMLMAGNIRPRQPINQRTVRTNINFLDNKCSMANYMYYSGYSYRPDKACDLLCQSRLLFQERVP